MSSIDPIPELSAADQEALLDVAEASIEFGLQNGKPLPGDANDYTAALLQIGASFVTLRIASQLRGCMGSLSHDMPLVQNVAKNAYSAAFADPRFPAMTEAEFQGTDIQISILSRPEPLPFDSETDLMRKLRPGVDGLILREDSKRGTFLPAVWQNIPDRAEFLKQLKVKAGLPTTYWSESIRVERYTTSSLKRSRA